MKKLLSSSLLAVLVFGVASVASAFQQKYTLDYGDQIIRAGQRNGVHTIKLKNQLKRVYGLRGLKNDQLINVRVVSKTKRGNGTATLYIGQRQAMSKYVNAGDFNVKRPRSFDRVDLMPRRSHRTVGKAWQVDLSGRHMLRKIVVTVQHQRVNPRPPVRPRPPVQPNKGKIVDLGSARVDKFFLESDSYYPNNGRKISRIRLVGSRNMLHVERAYVVFGNGQRRELPELQGLLDKNQTKVARVNMRFVQKIVIEAVSGIFGPGGEYKVQVRQHRR